MAVEKGRSRGRKKNRTGMFHAMLFLPSLFLLVFNYLPIFGIVMAFQNFYPGLGFSKSEWVGLDNFQTLFLHPDTWPAIRNTLIIAVGKIIGNLVLPVCFALMLNEVQHKVFKRCRPRLSALLSFLGSVKRYSY